MKVLVIGGGGREHTLAWKLKRSRFVKRVYCAPGNAGIDSVATCVPIKADDIDGLLDFSKENDIDLTVVGPEAPLAMGIVDRFEEQGLKIFGPSRSAARLESSKAFSKNIMEKYGVPTASFEVFDDPEDAKRYILEIGGPLVIKADGLAAGKGAIPCDDEVEALKAVDTISSKFGEAGKRILVEEYLEGEEASVLAFCDGRNVIPLESAQDHKRAFDDDQGPNTGGMGAYSPAPVITEDLSTRIYDEILVPTVKGMEKEGCPYKGILYAGLMITEDGPKVIEYNCRFGDPEAQVVIPRLVTDIMRPILACLEGNLDKINLRWSRNAAVCVVLASGGYPGSYEKGKPITGIGKAEEMENLIVFHAGTKRDDNGEILTNGGRVLGVTAMDVSISDTIRKAYKAVRKIKFDEVHYRRDIGKKAAYHLDCI
ncbi:MAG: phosphoribosylamine--glycine ligase [Thermoplasmatota archaeon]